MADSLYKKISKGLGADDRLPVIGNYPRKILRYDVPWHRDNRGWLIVVVHDCTNALFKIMADGTDRPASVPLYRRDIIIFDSDKQHMCSGDIEFSFYANDYPGVWSREEAIKIARERLENKALALW